MADGKWIADLSAGAPVADAARRVLMVRFEVVRDHLSLAFREFEKDPEHVHQLRVGTRRARAALDIFACTIPLNVYQTVKKHLRRIRRGAGEARDWDVFLANVNEWAKKAQAKKRPGLEALAGYALAQRLAAQTLLEKNIDDYPLAFDRLLAELVAAIHKPRGPGRPTLASLARPVLAELLKNLETAVAQDLDDYDNLHQVRIVGKRLRYAMEIFADCFPPAFREQIYPGVEKMQEVLGNANDSHVAGDRLAAISAKLQAMLPKEWKRLRPGVEGLLQYHRERLPDERKRFQDLWSRWQESGDEATLAALLKTPPTAPRNTRGAKTARAVS
jgi:CHAD domain-containing protein